MVCVAPVLPPRTMVRAAPVELQTHRTSAAMGVNESCVCQAPRPPFASSHSTGYLQIQRVELEVSQVVLGGTSGQVDLAASPVAYDTASELVCSWTIETLHRMLCATGTCVLRGCVPKKLMVIGGEFVTAFHDSKAFG